MNNRRRAPRPPSDPRAAALAVAAMAAAALSIQPPKSLPRLEPGFGRPGPAASQSPRAGIAPAPAAAAAAKERQVERAAPPTRTAAVSAAERGEEAPPATARLLSGLDKAGGASPVAAPAGRKGAHDKSSRPLIARPGNFAGKPARPADAGRSRSSALSTIERRSPRRDGDAPRLALARMRALAPDSSRPSRPLGGRGPGLARGGFGGARSGARSRGRDAAASRARADRAEKPSKRKPPRRTRRPAERRATERRAPHERGTVPFRPLLLAKLIGSRALRPPPAELEPPPRPADWGTRRPARDAGGRPISAASAGLKDLDGANPSDFSRDRRAGAHWDGEEWHDGEVRGLVRDGTWLRLQRDGARWWAFAGDQGVAQLRHDEVWWMKERGIWFVVHEGRPWAWRSFQDWDAQGLFQPGSGIEMVYSKDFARVAVIAPGEGAIVFDAASGAELARIPEARMPARRRPKAPPALDSPEKVFTR